MEYNTQEWINRLSKEIGILTTNNILLNLQIETYSAQYAKDQELIEGLKVRCLNNEEALKALREISHPMNTRKRAAIDAKTEVKE